ncbi:MAG: aldehyde ferredoxin oxidoreductase [Deltaproteobacteria bacterium]|nr:aldehyde ferredoxin oxidoreductase [Deltaproteobacteria bacterium]
MSRKFGKVLMVNLNDRSSKVMEIEPEVLKQFVGGAGLCAHLYSRLVKGDVAPLDPASPLMIMTGPLTGTPVPLSGRHGVAGRSPLTGFWGVGKAGKPVYLSVAAGKLEFKDAAQVWGKDCFVTDTILKKEAGEKAQVCSIGPAGEKLVKFAGVFTDGSHARAAARCGLGALMGSKMLKAVVVQGSEEIPVQNLDSLREGLKELLPSLTGKMKGMSNFGTPGLVVPCESMGDLPIKNWSLGKWAEGAKKIGGQELNDKYLKKQFFCAACPVGCGRTVASVLDPAVTETGGPEYETLGMMGSNCLIDDMPSVMRLNELTNRLGLDTIEMGAVIAFVMELFDRGLIGSKELGGLDMKWGNAQAAEALIRMVASREGFGDVLAEGLKFAADQIGGMAIEYAIQGNNMALPAHDPRAYASLALGYATSNRGPCHTAGLTHPFERAMTFPELGLDKVLDRFQSAGKGEMVTKLQNVMNLWENLALCKFSVFGGVQVSHMVRWLKDVAGWDFSIQDLVRGRHRRASAGL